jgi:hypothetical protein
MKEPSSGHNKNCKLETPYVAGIRSPPYNHEYIANVFTHVKGSPTCYIRGFQLTVFVMASLWLPYEPKLVASKTCVETLVGSDYRIK